MMLVSYISASPLVAPSLYLDSPHQTDLPSQPQPMFCKEGSFCFPDLSINPGVSCPSTSFRT